MKVNLLNIQQDTPPIKGIEVHVESVNKAFAMIVDNYCNASSSVCFPGAVRLDAIQPDRICSNVIERREVNILATITVPV